MIVGCERTKVPPCLPWQCGDIRQQQIHTTSGLLPADKKVEAALRRVLLPVDRGQIRATFVQWRY